MRQIALDTETTGLSTKNGDRVVEIGCVEIINRCITGKFFHSYINPERKVGQQTTIITGIKDDLLVDKPIFKEIADDFLEFIKDSELIIHNAPFDLEFINYELQLLNHEIKDLAEFCKVTDTLILARSMYPGQRNNLDALSKRHNVNVERKLHGALLDANILAQVALKMTAGQIELNFDPVIIDENELEKVTIRKINSKLNVKDNLKIIYADPNELELHQKYLADLT